MATLEIPHGAEQRNRLRVVTVHEFDGLAAHRAAWDRLAWQAPQRVPTLLPAWVESYLRHLLKPGESWFCSFAYRGEEMAGVLPAIVTPQPLLGAAHPRLRTLYDGATTFTGDIPLSSERPGEVLDALLSEARLQVPGHTSIVFRYVRETSPLWQALNRPVDGYSVEPGETVCYSRVDLAKGVAVPGRLRQNLKRYRKRLDGRGEVEIRIEPAEGATFLPEFLSLEASGWKGRAGTAIRNRPREAAFYADLVASLARERRAEWQTLRVAGRLVAAGLGVLCGDALILPKIAFDESFAEGGPGSLLTHAVMMNALARGFAEINHLSQADWHRVWHMDHDRYRDLHLVRSAVLPRVWQAVTTAGERAVRGAREQLRRHLPTAAAAYRRMKARWLRPRTDGRPR